MSFFHTDSTLTSTEDNFFIWAFKIRSETCVYVYTENDHKYNCCWCWHEDDRLVIETPTEALLLMTPLSKLMSHWAKQTTIPPWFTVQFIPGTFSTFSEMVRECFVLICETQSSEMCASWRCRTATHCCISLDSDSWTLTSALLPKLPTTSKNTSGSNTTSVENQQNEITGRWGHFLYRVNWGASHPLAFHMDKTSPQISFHLTKVWLKWRIFLGEIK